MKLFVTDNRHQKVYLNLIARTRQELASKIGSRNFFLANKMYSVSQVVAEKDSNNTATGAVVGGLVGAFGGPVGILVGGFLGGLLGNSTDDDEALLVNTFNSSR